LLGTTEWPGVEPSDVETGDRDRLIADYPASATRSMNSQDD
jgi:hypothetical protein